LQARRETNGLWALKQLCEVGNKYNVDMPACNAVRDMLRKAVREKDGVPSLKPEKLYYEIEAPYESTKQLLHLSSLVFATFFGLVLMGLVLKGLFSGGI